MRFRASLLLAILLAACSGEPKKTVFSALSREPLSVRGWIADVETSQNTTLKTAETEAARRVQLFQSTNVWIDNAPYVSGGIAENGSFVLLDVPSGNVSVMFGAPGIPQVKLLLENVPGNADVLIPGLVMKPSGVSVLQPDAIRIRIATKITKPQTTARTARVAGHLVPIVEVPANAMMDRRDYPNPPGFVRPLATVR